MKKILTNFIFLSMVFFVGCKEKVVEYIKVSDENKGFIELSYDKVEIGQKITSTFINFDSIHVYSVTFNKREVTFSQINDSIVTLIAPYSSMGNEAGNFVFYCLTNESDTVFVSEQVNYKYVYPDIRLNTRERIEKDDSRFLASLNDTVYWSADVTNDTVRISRQFICHDECGITENLIFRDKGNDDTLPEFLYATHHKNEMMVEPVNDKIINSYKIVIDEWDNKGIYSGTFTTQKYSWVFWVKKNN